jgi:hypothetical protein
MSSAHGGPVTIKPIGEIAAFIQKILPESIPEKLTLKPGLADFASEVDTRNGIAAYRDFLGVFCDRLISDGEPYAIPPKTPKSITDYPFLEHITSLLFDIGVHGKLSEGGDMLTVTALPSFSASVDENGKVRKPKCPPSKIPECFRFLTLCGWNIAGDSAVSEAYPLVVSYPSAPVLLTGLKVMAAADRNLRAKRYTNDERHDGLLLCDYRTPQAAEPDTADILRDLLRTLPEGVREFALRLHRRYTGAGMTCVTRRFAFENLISYAYIQNSRRVLTVKDIHYLRNWAFDVSLRHGFNLVIRAKKTDRYADVIAAFPPVLQELIARGYGCDRRTRNEPCQRGCHGFRIPLDNSVLPIGGHIERWLDHEVLRGEGK